jgi:methylated-DNA-[protein]-cysteine S-methyltransferase
MDPAEAPFDACLTTPFAVLGLRTDGEALTELHYLPASTPAASPRTAAAARAADLLARYLADPSVVFDLPLRPGGTPFQQRVWSALCDIPVGEVLTYGELARKLGSSPRAVGGACGANPIALVIPCHRVVSATGLGGFMGGRRDTPLAIKRWLLEHERAPLAP